MLQSDLFAHNSLFTFPGTKPLPLPLQPGFAWLDEQAATVTERGALSLDQALEMFLENIENGPNDWAIVSEQIQRMADHTLQLVPIRQNPRAPVNDAEEQKQRVEAIPEGTDVPADPIEVVVATAHHEPIAAIEPPSVFLATEQLAPKDFIDDKESDGESIAVPEEVDACESMQQLSLFSIEALQRGPPP